jgi:hypothetical protein
MNMIACIEKDPQTRPDESDDESFFFNNSLICGMNTTQATKPIPVTSQAIIVVKIVICILLGSSFTNDDSCWQGST